MANINLHEGLPPELVAAMDVRGYEITERYADGHDLPILVLADKLGYENKLTTLPLEAGAAAFTFNDARAGIRRSLFGSRSANVVYFEPGSNQVVFTHTISPEIDDSSLMRSFDLITKVSLDKFLGEPSRDKSLPRDTISDVCGNPLKPHDRLHHFVYGLFSGKPREAFRAEP